MSDHEGLYRLWGENAFSQALDRLRCEDKFSDFIICCRGKEWRVHRIILAASATFFEKLCSKDFKESREGKVDLEADDPTEIELMVQFIYSDKYYYKGEKVTDDNAHELLDSCGMDMRMYVLGDKYGINFLKEYAEDRLSNRRILGSRHGGCSRDIAMIRFAYTHSAPDDKTLKRMVVGEMYKHWQSNLLNTFDKSAWMELAAEVPEFIADVMKEIAKERMPGACLPGPLEEASSES